MTKDEYARAIESFIMEMTAVVEGERDPKRIPDFAEHANQLRSPQTADSELLASAFALFNEYVSEHWSEAIDESFRLFRRENYAKVSVHGHGALRTAPPNSRLQRTWPATLRRGECVTIPRRGPRR